MNELLRKLLFLPPQASSVAAEIDQLHYFVILTTMAGAALITVVGGYFLIRYRRTASHEPPSYKAAPRPPTWLEGMVVFGLLSLFVTWWWIGYRQFVRLRVPPPDTLDVYVTAKQWMWKFSYKDGGHSIAALYVPAGRPVKLIMTSRDVIHSFFVPDFRIKQDVLPGRYTTAWFEAARPGTYDILCAEMCGAGHSTMRGTVVALDADDFARWNRAPGIAGAPLPGPVYVEPAAVEDFPARERVSLVRQGLRVAAEQGCLRCHTTDGSDHIGPSWAGVFGREIALADGGRVLADEAYLTASMMDPAAQLRRGYKPVMPSYQGRLRPEETAALVELYKSLAENATPPMPPEVKP